MHCKRCGGEVSENDRYCRGCNGDLTKIGTIEPSVFNRNIEGASGNSNNIPGQEQKKENSVWDQIISEKNKQNGNNFMPSSMSNSAQTPTTGSDIFDKPSTPSSGSIFDQPNQGNPMSQGGFNNPTPTPTQPIPNSSWEAQNKVVVPPPPVEEKKLPIVPIAIVAVLVIAAILYFVVFKDKGEDVATTKTTTTATTQNTPVMGNDEQIINGVRGKRFDAYPEKTVGQAFDEFFLNSKWQNYKEGEKDYVQFTGELIADGGDAVVTMTFTVSGLRFNLVSTKLNNSELFDEDLRILLDEIYSN